MVYRCWGAVTMKGKKIKIRKYLHSYSHDHECFKHRTTYHKGGGFKDEKIIGWNDKTPYNEWTGVVKRILYNNNSHIDVIFDTKYPRTKSNHDLLDDCFNIHMGDNIEFLDK